MRSMKRILFTSFLMAKSHVSHHLTSITIVDAKFFLEETVQNVEKKADFVQYALLNAQK